MECCESKNIIKEKEMFFCTNCGTIHEYSWIKYDLMNMIKIFITY